MRQLFCYEYCCTALCGSFLYLQEPDAGAAKSSSPAMNGAHSRLAEGQQNSRMRAQTLLTFSRSPRSFRWSLQGLLRKTLPRHQALANKAVPARQPGRSSQTKCHRYELKLLFCRASCGIPHHKPSYEAVLDKYDRRTGKVYVYVKNKGKVPLYVYSKGSKLIDFDYKSFDRTLRLSGKSKSVKINPGKEQCVVYKIKGRATWPGAEDKKIRMKFKCLKITIKHKMNYAASPFWMFFL